MEAEETWNARAASSCSSTETDTCVWHFALSYKTALRATCRSREIDDHIFSLRKGNSIPQIGSPVYARTGIINLCDNSSELIDVPIIYYGDRYDERCCFLMMQSWLVITVSQRWNE